MSKFNRCYSLVIDYASHDYTSHAWIALHRCVEALARTKGETFNSTFEDLEKIFSFERQDKDKWPSAETIANCAMYMKSQRTLFLQELHTEIQQRKTEKQQGKRNSSNSRFLALCHQQNKHTPPQVGYWGWQKLRMDKQSET